MTSSSPHSAPANQRPTTAESESAAAIAPNPSRITMAMIHCALPSRKRAHQLRFDSGSSTIRRSTRLGRTLRICNSGGKQKRTVVRMPVPSPASAECQGRWRSQMDGQEFAQQGGEDPLHPSPERNTDQSAYQAEQYGLKEIDAQDVRGSRADRLHDGRALPPAAADGHAWPSPLQSRPGPWLPGRSG